MKSRAWPKKATFRPIVECLESRVVPYSLSGNSWLHPEMVTLSFAPDGTDLFITSGGVTQYSNLASTLNGRFPTASWQSQVLRAAQVWAQQTNLNFVVVSDSGAQYDSGDYQQGDPTFGDIRFGGYGEASTWLGKAYYPAPSSNTSLSGDEYFNTAKYWKIPGYTGTYDLFTVAAHEIGHSLGLGHSTTTSYAVMWGSYNFAKTALNADDINGIRAIYGGVRAADAFDAVASNGSFAAATNISGLLDANGVALITDLDVTSTADADFYKVVVPETTSGTMQVRMQSSGLSLLSPWLGIYNSGLTLLQSASGAGNYGHTLTLTISGVLPGQTYYIKADGAVTTAFGTGRYALAVNFGAGETPTASSPNTQTAVGDPRSYGGAVSERDHGHDPFGAETFGPAPAGEALFKPVRPVRPDLFFASPEVFQRRHDADPPRNDPAASTPPGGDDSSPRSFAVLHRSAVGTVEDVSGFWLLDPEESAEVPDVILDAMLIRNDPAFEPSTIDAFFAAMA